MRKPDITQVYRDDDFQLMMNSALRYALGRHTYMVKATADYLLGKLCYFSDNTLSVMEEDLRRYFETTVPFGGEFDCDIKTWMGLNSAVRNEFAKRRMYESSQKDRS